MSDNDHDLQNVVRWHRALGEGKRSYSGDFTQIQILKDANCGGRCIYVIAKPSLSHMMSENVKVSEINGRVNS